MDPATELTALRIRHSDGRLEPLNSFACRMRGSVIESLTFALPPGAELVSPGEHQPATAYHLPEPVA